MMRTLVLLGGLILLLFAAAPEAWGAEDTIFTAAGNGVQGSGGDGGRATDAMLNQPRGLALLPDGGFLVVEAFGHRVRRVFPDGTIRTVAGTGVEGFGGDGGAATSAKLDTPHAVGLLPDGGFLIADAQNHRVRKVSAGGTITTVAGTGVKGFSGDGGPAAGARVSAMRGLATLPDGGYLIADSDNNRVRKVSAGGIISTVAGTGNNSFGGDGGPATSAAMNSPFGVAPLPDGGFLIADADNRRVRRVSAAGTMTTVAGTGVSGFSGDGGPATTAQIGPPFNVTPLPDGSFMIADPANHRVRQVSASGTISTVAGTGEAGLSGEGEEPTQARLWGPKATLLFGDGFLIADADNNRVRFVGSDPWPSPPPGSGSVFIDGASAYASDTTAEVDVPAKSVSQVRLSNSPATSGGILTSGTTYPYRTPIEWNLADQATGGSGANGIRYVYVQWADAFGNWSSVIRDSIVLDTLAPTGSAPDESLKTGVTLGTSTIPVNVAWTGSDTTSGVAGYELSQSKNGGPFTTLLAPTTSTTWTGSLAPGASYTLRTRVTDRAGNASGWNTGRTFPLGLLQESSPAITYKGTWTSAPLSGASGGSVRYTTSTGASATVVFTGSEIAWVAPKNSARGSADVYLDGTRVATVNLRSTTKSRVIVYSKAFATPGSHTLEIRNLGTVGKPRIDVDAFVVVG